VNRSDIQFPPEHAALRADVHALGELIGQIVREQGGEALFELVELDRRAAIARRDGDAQAAAELTASVHDRPPALAHDLLRAFSLWFRTINLAENVHRVRRRREYFRDSDHPQPGGVESALLALRERGMSLEETLALIGSLHIEPVFSAHALHATRRSLLRKQQRVAQRLFEQLDTTLIAQERRTLWDRIRFELTTVWQTEELPRQRLTVGDEREHVVFYLIEILYRVLPAFYEEIALALGKVFAVPAESIELPCILRFGSWVGSDMDGHTDVHAKTIRETLARHQHALLGAYIAECEQLAVQLSQGERRIGIAPELIKRIEDYAWLAARARPTLGARRERMPYRLFLAQVALRLRDTQDGRVNGYGNARQLREDIELIAASLAANQGTHAGLFQIRRLLRRIDTFGFHLASLDVRQHAGVLHSIIAQGCDDALWPQRPRAERTRLLVEALTKDLGPRVELGPLARRTLAVFETFAKMRHRYGAEAIGSFVVSGTEGVDDVLAALLLARWSAVFDRSSGEVSLDIAPQLESISALEHSASIMQALLAEPVYRRHLESRGGRQHVLIGYSDSNMDAGLCASRFAIHQAQRALAETLAASHQQFALMHVRGASLTRGGGRVDRLVRSVPAGLSNGVLRLREQGETIRLGYGLRPIAMRTLERAFHALTLASAERLPRPAAAQHIACATTLAAASRDAYRALVHAQPEFHEFFRAVTPIDVIERMRVGSRTMHRADGTGIGKLLPLPWVFAWTQTRHLLPAWFGAGSGLRAACARHGAEQVRAAYEEWYFLHNLVDDIEVMLARADLDIAAAYLRLVPEGLRHFAAAIRAEYELTCAQVLSLKNIGALLERDPTQQLSIRLRNPYVDPMNLMQVDLLARWRGSDRADPELLEALLMSIAGIVQGLQSTG
jgi:phosphoenolpyruvate carboxylase